MNLQRTIKKALSIQGIGLHSGKEVALTLKPASPNAGIRFVRTDLEGSPEIPAFYKNVVNTQMATTLGVGRVTISTVEHLMAALQGLGIDNLIVEVNAPEIPILDGSSAGFVERLMAVGVQTQARPRSILKLRRRVEVKIAEKWAVAEPSSRLEVHASVEFSHPAVGFQEFHYVEGRTDFSQIASARTFGFLREVEALKRMGLALGGSLDNAVVLDDEKVLNPKGLRYPNEFVRHKVLDALGDFKLAGIAIQAHIKLHRAGHDLHRQLLDSIFKNPDHFEIIDGSEESRSGVALAGFGRAGKLAVG